MTRKLAAAAAIEAAEQLIAREGAWTRCAEARDHRGNPRPARSEDAVCWCAVGALTRVTEGDQLLMLDACMALRAVLPRRYPTVVCYNDAPGRTQEQVARWMRKAARRLRKEGAP